MSKSPFRSADKIVRAETNPVTGGVRFSSTLNSLIVPTGELDLSDALIKIQSSANIFDKSTITSGFISPISGVITASATHDTSDFIAVKPATSYYGRSASHGYRFVAYFDVTKKLIPDNNNAEAYIFTTPSNCLFVRVSLFHSDLASFQLEEGSSQTVYQEYGAFLIKTASGRQVPFGYIATATTPSTGWSGKNWATLGDSITAAGTWQPTVAAALGLTFSNFGVGGTKISGADGDTSAMCQDNRINAIPTTIDLVTVMGGTNDWAQSVALGSVNSTDPTTFYGALNTMFSKMFLRWPGKRIMLCTTPYGEMPSRVSGGIWTTATTNLQNLTATDYAEACRFSAKRWGVPIIDVSAEAGWNTVNITTFLSNNGNYLHPNSVGAKRISEIVLGVFAKLVPSI